MKRTAEDVIEIGNALIRQQNKLPHGMFLPWIETEFDMSQAAAYRFMNVAKKFSGKVISLITLNLEAIYELAAPSTPPEVQAEVERRVAAGELVNGADIRTLKAQFNEVSAMALDLERTADQVREENRDLMANAHRKAREEAEAKIRVARRRTDDRFRCTAQVQPINSNPRDFYRCKLTATLTRDGWRRVCTRHFSAMSITYVADDRAATADDNATLDRR
jgi:Protein of unknown function (DUF3102)